jgi:ABC-type amino acid transport substrate-binding protein
MTIIPWREKAVDFSIPTFPTQVWLVARADFPLRPIHATGDLKKDIETTKKLLAGHSLLGKIGTCLDPSFYSLENARADIKLYNGSLNEMAPAIINSEAELTLLDVADALVALQKWPGKIKVIGPISETQGMAVAFSKDSPRLRGAFDQFFETCKKNGTYLRMVKKYYQSVFKYYPDFFRDFR